MAFWNRKPSTVRVEFVDASTGSVFARANLPPEQLPQRFDEQTLLHVQDHDWSVMAADPASPAEFRKSGRLRLTVSKVTQLDPQNILFSLPTISDTLPAPAAGSTKAGRRVLDLHEDDWRQIEVFADASGPLVDEQLAAIRAVRETARKGPGFTRVHVRRGIECLLPSSPPCSLAALRASCPPAAEWLDGVGLQGRDGVFDDSFAVRLPSSVSLYGLAAGDALRIAAVQPAEGARLEDALEPLLPFLRAHRLAVVDWCRSTRFAIGA